PYAGLINVNGTLYGTTYEGGGANGGGTVFAITTSGKETLLHSFTGSGDGEYPIAGLIDVGGTLYGTTPAGGANDGGTVFALSP
ncbi:MAG: choice-of-anchor tandem repeat GloVer-containing protein, partial [Candidatus Cybelea sp.]